MVGPKVYFPHPQRVEADDQEDFNFVVEDPTLRVFCDAGNPSTTNRRLQKEHPVSVFIPEPRISARMPELPLFFGQSQNFRNSTVSAQQGNNNYNEPIKPTKYQSRAPSPLQLQSSLIFEKAAGNRLSNRLGAQINGIMSENVQQRYLFSKKPKYGPLSIPVTTIYHPVANNVRNLQDCDLFDRKEPYDHNYSIRPFGRRSSDVREPMPKLGQGDARLGDSIIFWERKASAYPSITKNSRFGSTSTCNSPASPPHLIYSSYSPKSPVHSIYDDSSRPGVSRIHGKVPQRSPVPIPTSPAPEKPLDQDPRSCTSGTHKKRQIMPTNTVTNPPVGPHAYTDTETDTEPPATHLKKMPSTYRLDATAAAFKPASLRTRPVKWRVQCRWTFENVEDCRYGHACHWGHEGDVYLDEPGVTHTFKIKSRNEEVNNITPYKGISHDQAPLDQAHYKHLPCDQSHHDQVVPCDLSEYPTYSASSGYTVHQVSDYGVQQYAGSRMPDFSWIGGATNVEGWLGSQDMTNQPVYEFETQVQSPVNLYGGAPVYNPVYSPPYNSTNMYGNAHMQDRSGNQTEAITGPAKKKKHGKNKKASTKHAEGKMKEAGTNTSEGRLQTALIQETHIGKVGDIENQLQGLQVEDTGFEGKKNMDHHI